MKIIFVPHQPHCFAFGGFEIQMLQLFNALSQEGIPVSKIDTWSRSLDFDILHLWGLEMSNFPAAYWAKRYNKKVVLTALIGQISGFVEAIKFKISERIGQVRFLKRVLQQIDYLVVVNELEAKKAIDYFGMNSAKVKIIPNMIGRELLAYTPRKIPAGLPADYFFCAGSISERKNQVSLAKAAILEKLNIVFAGNLLCSDAYKQRFLELINRNNNLHYISELPAGSNDLLDLFYYCNGFCLPSYIETQPISVLEASFFNKN